MFRKLLFPLIRIFEREILFFNIDYILCSILYMVNLMTYLNKKISNITTLLKIIYVKKTIITYKLTRTIN